MIFISASNTISKLGAVFYIIWACLHFLAAYSVFVLGRSLDSSMVQGRVLEDAWILLFFSIIAISVAATLNWRNSVWGGVSGQSFPFATQFLALTRKSEPA